MEIKVDENVHFQALNRIVRESKDADITLNGVVGQRYIADGLSGKRIVINGVPGNALGAYMNGCEVIVHGNVQEATGDTMNSGKIVVYGNAGDATGYAMRGGRIYIRDNTGYRAGIHMKAYMDFKPAIVIGGRAGSFLGEYLAGGIIIVLGLGDEGEDITGYFCGNGMYAGTIYLRTERIPPNLSDKLIRRNVGEEEKKDVLRPIITDFASVFSISADQCLSGSFIAIEADKSKSYSQLYAAV